ncbi:probable cytochrome P450 305a1 [Camponotus floridanus]|uniref:probable cytochrome P450 305a1 n=1 Tax=Camponotus floridanus TaxID=104421 RepID=UPI000DC6A041|nr:probable cytochrome P450 305a1 [Camponotus floridanus]XP_025265335.1 probable cytochrome P450 305a1 [Camponotus floridanus]XP_025265336.1 probable cytochrome P450 305a1 [Camponotus floridanus]XP_025265337.1 probable cytochrome P450 305a1 [Camponotus floridanus]XP_025265338.1 probable cytochrome P450 305a1 [Camponotus floridanus]
MIVTLTATILIILLITIILRQKSNYPPGPFAWPFVGNTYYLKKLSKKLGGQHLAFLELSKQYNSDIISLRLGGNDTIVVSNSKLIHEILNKREYDGRPWNEFIKLRNMGMKKGITMNDGSDWNILRTWSICTLKKIGFVKQEMMQLLLDELVLIMEKLKDGGVQHIQTVIAPSVINVLWTLITGKRVSEDQSRLQILLDLMTRRSQKFDMSGGILSSFPWLRFIVPEISGYKILVTLNNELKNLLMETINEHKQKYVEGKEKDFIDAFLHEMFAQQYKDVFSDDNLIVTLLDLFFGGIKTTTATLEFLFLQIVNHQDVQRKVHEEIDVVIGPNRYPILEDGIKMPFTKAVLVEAQRMWLVTPVIGPRRVLHDTILGGYTIPKNTTVLMNVFHNNMNPELFPDPTSFKPERHLKEDGTYRMDENIILFGKGKRRCPAEAFAKNALFLLFISIMQKYRLLPVPGEKSIKAEFTSGLIIAPKPYEVLIVPR